MPVKKTPAEAQAVGEPPASIAVLNLFGQQATFPVNLYLVSIIVVLVCGLVAMDFISRGGISQTIQKVMSGSYSTLTDSGAQKNTAPTRIYQFWTPGVETWPSVLHSCEIDAKNDTNKIAQCKKDMLRWETGHSTDHPTLKKFGQALKDKLNLPGFTRYEVTGSGQYITEIKGWMWKIILPDDNKLNEKLFLEVYKSHFKRGDVKIEKHIIGE
ncbi:hypothetical protein MNBD_GAMMA10-852 [hydrothermal vent metagenome]|uniref:Uncharacterized protein n=1 Tax=hydrothermal vent metagenome TaxID=652676 RepID=A0A3B0YXD5_9ZZZZ